MRVRVTYLMDESEWDSHKANLPAPTEVVREDCFRWTWSQSGRGGTLESVYLVDARGRRLIEAAGKVHLGEVLGKHSDVTVDLRREPGRFDPAWGPTGSLFPRSWESFGFWRESGIDVLDHLLDDVFQDSGKETFDEVLAYLAASAG